MEADFQYGDIIEFCGDRFLVLENYGDRGKVVEYPKGEDPVEIDPFYWEFEGSKCVKV